jgi:hypothetical protein
MFRAFLEFAFVIMVIAWVLAEVLSALGRWSGEHRNSELARDIDIEPAKHPDELDFGTLGLVLAMVLVFVLLVPSVVTSNGQSISLHEISDSMRASMGVGPVATFVSAWRAESPLGFWGFFAGLLVAVIWLFYRSPVLLGVAVVAALFILWLKMNAGIASLSF